MRTLLAIFLSLALGACASPAPVLSASDQARAEARRVYQQRLLANLLPGKAGESPRFKGGVDPLARGRTLRLLDELGITSGGVYTPPESGWVGTATSDLDMDDHSVNNASGVFAVEAAELVLEGSPVRLNGNLDMDGNNITSGTGEGSTLTVAADGDLTLSSNGDVVVDTSVTVAGTLTVGGVPITGSSSGFSLCLNASYGIASVGTVTPTQSGSTTRFGRSVQTFPAETRASCDFETCIPESYNTASTLTVEVDCVSATATTGNVVLDLSFERLHEASFDLDAAGFDSVQQSAATPCSATSGVIFTVTVTFTQTQADEITPGDLAIVRVLRQTEDEDDDMAGDLHVLALRLKQ